MISNKDKLNYALGFLNGIGVEVLDAEQGFIRCPGEYMHRAPTRGNHCRVYPTPWVHCFHQSCAPSVDALNRKLTQHFRIGQIAARQIGIGAKKDKRQNRKAQIIAAANRDKGIILQEHRWPYASIIADSPERISFRARHHWYYIVNLFADEDVVWIGRDIHDSGKPNHRWRFRPALKWMAERVCPGMFICPNIFKSGVHSRSDANVFARKFLVVESDSLGRDEVGAIFKWLERAKGMRLRAVVDTAGKSLHGWFDYPPSDLADELKIILPELGCDKALFGASQPCRLPGATRDGKFQTLIYLNHE